MANPIIGALFLGMVSTGPGQSLPVPAMFAQALPTPQCVRCGPANRPRVASLEDWSNPRAKARYLREVEGRKGPGLEDLLADQQLGMTEQQVHRLAHYAGV